MLVFFSFISILSVYFLFPNFLNEIILPDNGDNNIAVGIIMHNMKSMASFSFADIYHFPIYFPYSFTLTAGVNFIGQSVLLLPFYLTGIKNIYFLYNLLLFLSLVLGGIAVYFLIKEVIGSEIFSVIGGGVYILLPLRQINYPHPHLLYFFFSIFVFLFLIKYVKNFKRKDAFLFFFFLFLQSLFSITLFFLTSIFSFFLFLIFIAIKGKITLKNFLELTIGLVLLGVFIYFVFTPYITNPLEISYEKTEFSSKTLLRSWDFYSTWFPLTFKFLRGRSTPLFLGFVACFFIFYFFYSKAKAIPEKVFSFLLLPLLIMPVLITFYKKIPLRDARELVDVLFILLMVVFFMNILLAWKKAGLYERFVLCSLSFVFLSSFRSLFEIIPLKTNLFYLNSLVIPQLARLRGFKFKYYFIVFWILLIFLGFQAFIKKRKNNQIKTVAVFLLGFLMFFENFPPPLGTGRLREHNVNEKALYKRIEKYPLHYGVLELPHFRGFGDNKIYSLYTIYHDKHVYNGFYGVGIFDPLKIFKSSYFHPIQNIPEDINDPSILTYLRENGIRIIVFHRSLMIFGKPERKRIPEIKKQANQSWGDIVEGFVKAKKNGLLAELDILDNGITAVLNDQNKAQSFKYQYTYYYVKSKRHALIHMKRISEKPVKVLVEFNGEVIFQDQIKGPDKEMRIKIPPKKKLKARGNYFDIKCSDEVYLDKIELIK